MEKCEEGEFNGGLGMTTPFFIENVFLFNTLIFTKSTKLFLLL